MSLSHKSLVEMQRRLDAGDVSSVELVDDCLERMASRTGINAFITILADRARNDARNADRQRADGSGGPLCGLPLAVKDNICLKGAPTTCGSKILESFVPPYDATVVEKLRSVGAIVLGKTNLDEFSMGSSNENSYFGPVKNPHDQTRVPGGSSGGSAAAVADFQVPAALGSDTGGSVRQPASFCGVVGLKPTYGAVSRYGLVAFASSLDQIGVLAGTVADCALVFSAICGPDARDSTSAAFTHPDYFAELRAPRDRLKIGVPREYFAEGLQSEIGAAVEQTIGQLAAAGHQVSRISLPHTRYAIAAYYVIANAEASSNLARYDGVTVGYRTPDAPDISALYRRSRGEGFGDEVKRRIILGTHVLSAGYNEAYYNRAQKVRAAIAGDFARAFEAVNVIVGPTTPTVAFALGEKTDDPLAMYLSDFYTVPANLAGLPGISVPCGMADGLPIGFQILGPRFSESVLLSFAADIEHVRGNGN